MRSPITSLTATAVGLSGASIRRSKFSSAGVMGSSISAICLRRLFLNLGGYRLLAKPGLGGLMQYVVVFPGEDQRA